MSKGDRLWELGEVFIVVLICAALICFTFAIGARFGQVTIDCLVPEDIIVHVPVIEGCEPTYGPLPVPLEGKEAWGFTCDEGLTF